MSNIKRNAFRCKRCGMVVESKSVHDFEQCKCGNFTDGGLEYIRRGGKLEDMEDLSEPNMYFDTKKTNEKMLDEAIASAELTEPFEAPNKVGLLPKDICLTNVGSEFQMSDELADKFSEEVNDFLSEHWGFCTRSWSYKITINDIDWDAES